MGFMIGFVLLLMAGVFDLAPHSAETQRWVNFLEVERAQQTSDALARAVIWVPRLKPYFHQEGVPEDLVWLALIETSFRPDPTSPTGAQGMFQFKAETARLFGLTVVGGVDERNDPHKAARAAARYLNYLHNKFQDWDLVLAAYNLGEGDLFRAMKRRKVSTWKAIQPHVRKETRHYVAKVKAAAVIGNRHLNQAVRPQESLTGTYRVQKGDTLYSIARHYQLTAKELKHYNGLHSNLITPGQILRIPVEQN